MIISHKYKYLFIGLPFSASSAISKELNTRYEGQPLLRKHSLFQEFTRIANKEEKEYFHTHFLLQYNFLSASMLQLDSD